MKDGHNDNDELSFLHIAAATANVVRYLREKQISGADEDQRTADKNDKENSRRKLAVIGTGEKDPNGFRIALPRA